MKKLWLVLFTVLVGLGLGATDAEAGRLGGGRSFGMPRQSVAPRPAPSSPNQQQLAPTKPAAPAGAPTPAAPQRSWLGPLTGLAAGLGLAALFSHFGLGGGMADLLSLALLAMAGAFVFKTLFRRNAAAPSAPDSLRHAGPSPAPAIPPAPGFASADARTAHIPADFDATAFLRVAKLNFVRLQAANDAKNLDDIREFVAPEVFAEIKMQMDERGEAPQQTDVVTLDAELLEIVSEGKQHIASVRFSGMIREASNSPAEAFAENWILSKPSDGSRGWVVAGIQQIS